LILLMLALGVGPQGLPYPIPITILGVGGCCFFLAGIPWAHTQGQRGLKTAFLGAAGFAGGGTAGAFAGDFVGAALGGGDQLGMGIVCVIGGIWVGGILFAWIGIRWGIRFHRRYGLHSSPSPSRS
jgi:hypothetical protein